MFIQLTSTATSAPDRHVTIDGWQRSNKFGFFFPFFSFFVFCFCFLIATYILFSLPFICFLFLPNASKGKRDKFMMGKFTQNTPNKTTNYNLTPAKTKNCKLTHGSKN
jgi:hypothetical protein